MNRYILLFLLGLIPWCVTAGRVEIVVDSSRSDARMMKISQSGNLRRINSGKRSHLVFSGRKAAGEQWERYEVRFTPHCDGEIRLILRSSSRKLIAYDHFANQGGEKLRNPSLEKISGGVFDGWQVTGSGMAVDSSKAFHGKNYLYASRSLPAEQTIAVSGGEAVTISFYARKCELPPPTAKKAVPLPVNDHPAAYYRVYNEKVKYLPLKDKGLTPAQITPVMPEVPTAPPPPRAEFVQPDNRIRSKTDFFKVPVELLEENEAARCASIRFGLPLAQGQFYNLSTFRVTDGEGRVFPAQFAATAFWADRSIKCVLVQFQRELKEREKAVCFVEAGEKLPPKPVFPQSPLKWVRDKDRFLVDTGVLSAEIDLKNFNLLKNVAVNGRMVGSFAPEGIVLVPEDGKSIRLSAVPVRCTVEEAGMVRLTLRIDGAFCREGEKYFDFTGRLSFYANSGKVDMELRFINTYLKTEFNDFSSLVCRFIPVSEPQELEMNNYRSKRFFQHHDRKLQLDEKFSTDRLNGSGLLLLRDGEKISFNLFKAGLRYPKGFAIRNGALEFELLPELDSPQFGSELPYYLNYPFCEGFYRMKWGMGFREQLSIDFSGQLSVRAVNADAIVPVISRDDLAASGVFPGVHPAAEKNFAEWDKMLLDAFYEHIKLKEKQREYGFLNYGDWFGERGRNWGNNEYDLANGLFMLFLRTGNRDLFRWAQQAAIHQADTDIVHAYPDPAFIGCNAQHGIGHTGVSYQHIDPAPWSYRYNAAYLGSNGHTWSEGMTVAWMLAGDGATMDSALLLGEHLTRYTAPRFYRLSTHERSAGWSCRALTGLYRATGNRKYLDAAARLIECILAEQKPARGGAWPHKMPRDHSGGNVNTYGNCPYLVAIVIAALREYYLLVPDERVRQAIIMASRWQYSVFQPALAGWPYAASWDGNAYFPAGGSGAFTSGSSLAAGARLSGDEALFNAAKLSLAYGLLRRVGSNGKRLAVDMCMAAGFMDELRIFAKENPRSAAFEYTPGMMEHFIGNYRHPIAELALTASQFRVCGGRKKEFRITASGNDCTLNIRRRVCGFRKKGIPQWTARLLDGNGRCITKFSGRNNETWERKDFPLIPGNNYRLLIEDDYMGEWHISGSRGVKCSSLLLPGYTFICGLERATGFYIQLPEGVESAEFEIAALDEGIFRAAVSDGESHLLARADGRNTRRFRPWENRRAAGKKFTVSRDKSGNGIFKLSVWGSGSMTLRCNIPGVMLSLEK